MSDLSERIANLSPEKRELLRRLLSDEGPKTESLSKAPRKGATTALPTSFAQQRLWFLDRLEPGSSFYNIFDAIPFNGTLDERALKASLAEIVRRHESLRTTFGAVDGAPVQIIAASMEITLPVIDLSGLEQAEREEEMTRRIAEESELAFDLAKGPLLRTTLLRVDEEEHFLLLNMHHIISDAWSLEVFARELRALYEAFRSGKTSPLPELPVQYADFAIWQREWLRGETLEQQLAYWRQRLAGAPTVLELPTDRPRPPVQAYRGARQTLVIPADFARDLRSLGQREGVTLFMTMLAAFDVLMLRYTGQDDLMVGTPIANRSRAELEGLIGFFINTLVLRADLSGDPSFRELLKRVKEVALGAYAHQDLPFEMLVSELHPERDMSRNPLFQVTFQLTTTAEEGSTAAASEIEEVAAKFDLLFNVWDSGGDLKLQADYNTDLFDDATIERMLGHYERILEGAVANPDQRLSRLPLLTFEEEQWQLVDWNDTESTYPRDACLHELFEENAERSPQAIAVSFGDEQLTYRELNERANQVARRLRALDVGPEGPIGICMERSTEMVVGMLAILKAGGVYVPLDPEYPSERLAFMLEDAGVSALLTQAHLLAVLPEFRGEVLCLDNDWKNFAGIETGNISSGAVAESLAYVIYTSGSTGRPKGVGVPHRAVTRLVCNTNYIKLGADDRIAQASTSTFDAATFEVWGALLHGARLIGISKDDLLSPRRLAAQVREHAISVMFLPTAIFNQTASEIPDAFSSVHSLLVGGDEMNPARTREVLEAGPPTRLLNAYGPTEGTTFSSWHRVEDVADEASRISIGRPLSNTQFYILDAHYEPVAVGVSGELYIGGDGLARGYLHRAELTAERFIPNLFSSTPGSRLYRTGDIARYLSDGEIEFLGRRDGQVKVRGYRVEVGEVEAVLRGHEGVRDAVVVAREDGSGHKALAAYVVAAADNGERVTVGELRGELKARLPEYMVPASFVMLEELPLNANGKIDRNALPDPEQDATGREKDFALPATPIEEKLAEIFSSVLGHRSVSVRDNFFDLGGHSLMATQVISRIRERLQVEVPLRSLFMSPTISGLAEVIEEELKTGKNVTAPAITRVSRAGFRATVSADGSLKIPDVLKSTLGGEQ